MIDYVDLITAVLVLSILLLMVAVDRSRGRAKVSQARFIKKLANFQGDARLFQVEPPMKYERYDDDGEDVAHTTAHVVVSATTVFMSGPETYIFPCDEQGDVKSWSELTGSFRGGLDHAEALRGAGYEVTS